MMSEVKCHLEGMPWHTLDQRAKFTCALTLFNCTQCNRPICINHMKYGLHKCEECVTLRGEWGLSHIAQFYDRLYSSKTKACKQ